MSDRKIDTLTIKTEDGRELSYTLFLPETPPKAILHVLPGLAEDPDRLEETGLPAHMTAAGILVCCTSVIDDVGHKNRIGSSDLTDRNTVTELFGFLRKKYRSLPYVVLGIGVGSLILRSLLPESGSMFDGCALCGTYTETAGTLSPLLLAGATSLFLGETHICNSATKLHYGRMNALCKSEQGHPLSWLSSGQDNSRAEAPYLLPDGKIRPYTAGLCREIYRLIREFNTEDAAEKLPKSLPVLLISGKEDPAGGMGEGIRLLYQAMFEAELDDLQIKLYDGCRHSLLFEPCREQLFVDLENWIEGICTAKLQCATLPVARIQNVE